MADFDELHRVIHSIASGFKEECVRCMEEHKNVLVDCIQEQLYSGLDGTEHLLNPDYDTDTYFNEPGPWQNRAEQYKRWKERITPPLRSEMLYLPPRPVEVPNLFITGTFYDSITADRIDSGLRFSTKGFTDGSSIEKKYGEQILGIGDTAKEYFSIMYLRPWMERFGRKWLVVAKQKRCRVNWNVSASLQRKQLSWMVACMSFIRKKMVPMLLIN